MSLDARLGKLLPALSAHERAVLLLRSDNAGQNVSDLQHSVPSEQRRQFNRYVALLFVGRWQFEVFSHMLAGQITGLDFSLTRIELLERAAGMLEEDHPEEVAAAHVRPWRKQPRQGSVTVPLFLRSLAAEVREDAFKELCVRWQELRALEIVADEIAQHFDGEDPLRSEARSSLQTCAEELTRLNARLFARPRRLPEPTAQLLEEVRGLVERGLETLGLLEA